MDAAQMPLFSDAEAETEIGPVRTHSTEGKITHLSMHLPEIPQNAVVEGDCVEIMRQFPDASVDCVITDPPYSSGTRREASKGLRKSMRRGIDDAEWFGSDSLTTQGFFWLMHACAVQWHRIVKPGGHILSFIDWRMAASMSGAIESADLRHLNILVWDKTYFGMGAWFRNQHEFILHFSNGPAIDVQRHDTGNVLRYKPIRNGQHPTEKPTDLLGRLVATVCPKEGIVLDPFAGSGSTCIAAFQSGRQYIGIERESAYVAIARQRLARYQVVAGA